MARQAATPGRRQDGSLVHFPAEWSYNDRHWDAVVRTPSEVGLAFEQQAAAPAVPF